jgi:5-methylcytosine-specific restriction enzyme subunit McrC
MNPTVNQEAATPPLTTAEIPIRNLWYMLLYAWNELWAKDLLRADAESAPSLDALLATVLSTLVTQRLRIGLGCNYRNDEARIRGIRGRVDFSTSLKRMAFQQGSAHCRFQSYSPNVPKNQLIRSTLYRLARIGDFGPERSGAERIRHKAHRLVRDLDMVDLVDFTPDAIRREQLLRHDADYRLMLAICFLVSQRYMPTESAGDYAAMGLDRDAMTMWRVFERFVANFYAVHLANWTVTRQASLDWNESRSSPFLPSMSVDLLLRSKVTGRIVMLDTKFTSKALILGRWEKLTFDRSHLFQIYAYLRSQDEVSPEHRQAQGVLLYPTVKHSLSEAIDVQGHRIRWETVDLSREWQAIEQRLVGLIESE